MLSPRVRALLFISLAELLLLSLWFSASAVLPALAREWQLGDGGKAGLTLAVQLGFIVGTLLSALSNLPDLVPPRRLMMAGGLVGAACNAALALWVAALWPALLLRFATGLCMACAYPPAMKLMATWFRKGRGLAIGVLIGALSIGSATPHLIRGVSGLPWRTVLLCASGLALLGVAVVALLLREGPDRFPPARFDLRMAAAVLRERPSRLACFGYFGHMWELYAMWAWLGVFLDSSLQKSGAAGYLGLNASSATFLTMGPGGALGAYLGGVLAERYGRTALTMAAMALSGTCALLIGLSYGGPPLLTLLLALLWGATVIADSAQFSTAVTELSPPEYVGTALTTQTCLGFLLTLASIWLLPVWTARLGWRWGFAPLAVGPLLGVLAMARLRALPAAERLAQGRR